MKQTDEIRPAVAPLWTRDFTIITLGSVVSMLGNAMSGFALSLLVLDYTESSLLYAIYIATFTAPQIIAPIFSGAILDRFSRKRTIYTLDFISAGIYAMAAFILSRGWFSFPVLAVWCFIIGTINSVYMVAYESFLPPCSSPRATTQGLLHRQRTGDAVGGDDPHLHLRLQQQVGIAPLLGINAVCFRPPPSRRRRSGRRRSTSRRKRPRQRRRVPARRLLRDIGEGFRFLWSEKGLLAVACYFAFSSLAGGASQVITLPYFKGAFPQRRIRVHAGVGHDGGGPYRRWAGTL